MWRQSNPCPLPPGTALNAWSSSPCPIAEPALLTSSLSFLPFSFSAVGLRYRAFSHCSADSAVLCCYPRVTSQSQPTCPSSEMTCHPPPTFPPSPLSRDVSSTCFWVLQLCSCPLPHLLSALMPRGFSQMSSDFGFWLCVGLGVSLQSDPPVSDCLQHHCLVPLGRHVAHQKHSCRRGLLARLGWLCTAHGRLAGDGGI